MSSFLMHYFQDIDRSIYQDRASDKNDPEIITKLQIKEGMIIFVHCKHMYQMITLVSVTSTT